MIKNELTDFVEIYEVVIFYFNLFFNQSKLGVRFTKMRNSSNEMEAFFESIAIINNKPKGHLTNSNNLFKNEKCYYRAATI